MAVARILCEEGRQRGEIKGVARLLEVTPRTLENWMTLYLRGGRAKTGRPTYTNEDRWKAMWAVRRELRRQGYCGWRPIDEALNDVPTRLVQEYVKKFKAWKKHWDEVIKKEKRQGMKVLLKNAYCVGDGTFLGRIEKKGIESQVIKDRGSLKVLAIGTGLTAKGEDVVKLLDDLKANRKLPLVFGTDNGSMYCNEKVNLYLKKEKVVHLLSLPRTPEHNGSAENLMREMKKESLLGRKTTLLCIPKSHDEMVSAASKLNWRLRGSKRFKSANELDDTMIDATDVIDREMFYAECEQGLMEVRAGDFKGRELRMKEREVIIGMMEKFGAVKLTRGVGNYGEKCEVIL